jgi:hypothetical protein
MKWQPMRKTGEVFVSPYEGEMDVWANDRYLAFVREWSPGLIHLSITDRDKTDRHNWRDFQRIKNDICGTEAEGVELYPAESRLVDTSNHYHLWVFTAGRVSLGFQFRAVADGQPLFLPAHQSPFGDDRPGDCTDISRARSWSKIQELLPELFKNRGRGRS